MPHVIWSGSVEGQTFRVVDMDPGSIPRVQMEILGGPDLLGVPKWGLFDPVPMTVFAAILVASGVVT